MKFNWLVSLCLLLVVSLAACVTAEPQAAVATDTPVVEATEEESVAVEPSPVQTPTATPEPDPTPAVIPTEIADVEATPALPDTTATPALDLAVEAISCPEELSAQDALVAQQFPAAGCPEGAAERVYMAWQSFQHGQMLWRQDTQSIYVLHEDGSWRSYEDTFEEGQPESDPGLAPPPNLLQPIRGFGQVWRQELGGPEAAIGWATTPEAGVNASAQEWENGMLLVFDLANRFLLLDDGRWARVQ